jgi:hypothetical protein
MTPAASWHVPASETVNEFALISSLNSLHSSGLKISQTLEQPSPANWHIFNGGIYDLIFAPVESRHDLLILGEGIASTLQLPKTLKAISASRKLIEKSIERIPTSTVATPKPPDSRKGMGQTGRNWNLS